MLEIEQQLTSREPGPDSFRMGFSFPHTLLERVRGRSSRSHWIDYDSGDFAGGPSTVEVSPSKVFAEDLDIMNPDGTHKNAAAARARAQFLIDDYAQAQYAMGDEFAIGIQDAPELQQRVHALQGYPGLSEEL